MKLLHIAARNIFRNRHRSILSLIAIAMATMTITFLFALIAGMGEDISNIAQTYLSGSIRVRHEDFDRYEKLSPSHLIIENSQELLRMIDLHPAVSTASRRVNIQAAVFRDGQDWFTQGIGVDFEREKRFQKIEESLIDGSLPREGSRDALVGREMARELSLAIGDSVTILTTTRLRGSNAFTIIVSGIAAFPLPSLDSLFLIPIDRADRYLRMNGAASEILIKTDEPAGRISNEIQRDLLTDIPAVARSWDTISTSYTWVRQGQIAYIFVALLFFILGSSVIVNTTMMVILERMREIGTLAAIGMRGGELITLFLLESILIGAVASLTGGLLGTIIAAIFSGTGIDLSGTLGGVDFDISNVIYPKITIFWTMFTVVYSTAIAAIASLLPSLRTAKINPVEALRAV